MSRIITVVSALAVIMVSAITIAFTRPSVIGNVAMTGIMGLIVSVLVSVPCAVMLSRWMIRIGVAWSRVISSALVLLWGVPWVLVIGSISPSDDQLSLLVAATHLTDGGLTTSGTNYPTGVYMERYPYQSGPVLLIWEFMRMTGLRGYAAYHVLQILGVVLMSMTVIIIGWCAGLMASSRVESCSLAIMGLYAPIGMFGFKVYGNVMAMPLMALTMGMCVLCVHERCWFHTIGLMASCAFMVALKPNTMILVIAVVIILMMDSMRSRSWVRTIPMIGAIIAAIMGVTAPVMAFGRITGLDMTGNRQPAISWLATGLTSSRDGGYGTYDSDVLEYTKYSTMRVTYDRGRITFDKAMAGFVNDPSSIVGFMTSKMLIMWADPSYGDVDYPVLMRYQWTLAKDKVHTVEYDDDNGNVFNGTQSWFYRHMRDPVSVLMDGFQAMIWALIGWEAYRMMIRHEPMDPAVLLPLLLALGGIMFHMAWEVRPEYAMPYMLMLMPYAGMRMAGMVEV